jgi:hypothetical protein
VKTRHESILVDLARIGDKYGADELVAVAKALRDPRMMEELASLLERVAERARTPRPHRSPKSIPKKSASSARQLGVVRTALRDTYTSFDALDPLLERLGLNPDAYKRIADAHDAILDLIARSPDGSQLTRVILDSSVHPAGELDQLTAAIVTNTRKR